jgi:hypothetical protein
MYLFTKVSLSHRIWHKLADQSRHVQQQVLQFANLGNYGPAVHGEIGRRFDSCHGLQMERQIVAPVGFLLAEMLAECRQMDRQGVQKTTGPCLVAPISTQTWYLRSG